MSSQTDSSKDSTVFHTSRTGLLKAPIQIGSNVQSSVSFILPEITKLSEDVVTNNLTILFVYVRWY